MSKKDEEVVMSVEGFLTLTDAVYENCGEHDGSYELRVAIARFWAKNDFYKENHETCGPEMIFEQAVTLKRHLLQRPGVRSAPFHGH